MVYKRESFARERKHPARHESCGGIWSVRRKTHMMDFVEAVKRPLRTDPVTIVLGIFFMVFLPLRPLLHGLGIETARRTQQNHETMPHFDDFIDLFLSGLIALVVAVLFFLPALIVLMMATKLPFTFFFDMIATMASRPLFAINQLFMLAAGTGVLGIITLITGFLASIMAPVGIQLFAHDKKIGSAFEFSKLMRVVTTAEYWVTWLLLLAYGIVLLGLVAILSIPEFNVLSALFLAAAGYLWWMTAYILFAETVKDSGVLNGRGNASHTTSFKRKLAKKKKKR